jgi:phospholipase C
MKQRLRFASWVVLPLLGACSFAGQSSAPNSQAGSNVNHEQNPLSVMTDPSPLQFTAAGQTGTVTLVEQNPPPSAKFTLNATYCTNKNVLTVSETDSQHYTVTQASNLEDCTLVASDGTNRVDVSVNPTRVPVKVTVPSPKPRGLIGGGKIQHVVIIVQENRSFDNLFNGFPHADTVRTANNMGTIVPMFKENLNGKLLPVHSHPVWYASYDGGKMDGFAAAEQPGTTTPPFAYVPKSQVESYWSLAESYGIGDRMFQSNTGGSFAAHLYLIAGQSDLSDVLNIPGGGQGSGWPTGWGCADPPGSHADLVQPNSPKEVPGPFPCFNLPSIGQELDAKGLSWRYYADKQEGIWNEYEAVQYVYNGPDWLNNIVVPETRILTDPSGPSGTLADVTWVTPSWEESDHPGDNGGLYGPQWVPSVVNAIGQSSFWDSTAIFIVWDDWGGWYDHVAPPQLDSMGLSFRVPLLVISPYAKTHYVSHVTHEDGSILRFVEEAFGLSAIAASDKRADDLGDFFDFNQAPTPFTPFPTVLKRPEDFKAPNAVDLTTAGDLDDPDYPQAPLIRPPAPAVKR